MSSFGTVIVGQYWVALVQQVNNEIFTLLVQEWDVFGEEQAAMSNEIKCINIQFLDLHFWRHYFPKGFASVRSFLSLL